MQKIVCGLLLCIIILVFSACSSETISVETTNPVSNNPDTSTSIVTTSYPVTSSQTLSVTTTIDPTTTITSASAIFQQLKSGWRTESVYEHILNTPSALTRDGQGNLLVLSRGNNRIISVSPQGELSIFADINQISGISTIKYQPERQRLLAFDRKINLYYHDSGQWNKIKQLTNSVSTLAIDNHDSSFYGGNQHPNGEIVHFDADGNKIALIADDLNGCFQIVLDEINNILYYSETYPGTITALNLKDKSSRIIASGIGIPGTFEPIAIGLDDLNRLYYFTANQGLNRYEKGSFQKVMDSISGVGEMSWSTEHKAFLVCNEVGSNIIAYDPDTAEARHLTPYVNAWSIVETHDGTVLIADNNILKVDQSGLSVFIDELPAACSALERDDNGLIYAGLTDGSIWIVNTDGSLSEYAQGFSQGQVVNLSYDRSTQTIISLNAFHWQSRVEIWRIPLEFPNSPDKITEMSNIIVSPTLPRATVDYEGNIYILERQANTIYRIEKSTSKLVAFISGVLENDAITVPGLEYSHLENALVVSTISNYELWPLNNPVRQDLAQNLGSVDNFCLSENLDGSLIAIQSGRIFRFIPDHR